MIGKIIHAAASLLHPPASGSTKPQLDFRVSEKGDLSWAGTHPIAVQHSIYWIQLNRSFCSIYDDATHEVYVGVTLKDTSPILELTEPRIRPLYRKQADLRMPGLTPHAVAYFVGKRLLAYLQSVKDPRVKMGLYHQMIHRKAHENPWDQVLNQAYSGLLRSQLAKLNLKMDDYLVDPEYFIQKHDPHHQDQS